MFATNTPLGLFVRSKSLSALTGKYPIVISLRVNERLYLNTNNTFKTGYDIEIELGNDLKRNSSGYKGSYQVYDDGREMVFQGSNEWSGRSAE